MFSDIVLIHNRGALPPTLSTVLESTPGSTGGLFWKTCLRQIAFFSSDDLETIAPYLTADDEVYTSTNAYLFLLQVICGLHSPLVGETEVYGQFKNAVAGFAVPISPWGGQLRRFFHALFEDAKKVRQTHLVDLGSQSYGSVIRRELRELKQIHVLGAGHLVEEILPWIAKDGSEVHIHCRNPDKARRTFKNFPMVKIHGLGPQSDPEFDMASAQSLVIAAPVTSEWLENWLGRAGATHLQVVTDTRADSATDLFTCQSSPLARVLTLTSLLERISSNQALIEARKQGALALINELKFVRERYVENRPFGWEDVCA